MIKVFEAIYMTLTLLLGLATIIEDKFVISIYDQTWFVVLLVGFAMSGLTVAIKKKIWTDIPVLFTHISLATILIGAFLSYATGQKGYVHLLRNQPCNQFIGKDASIHQMPFSVVLDSFSIKCYPGTEAHMDYVSHLKVDGATEAVSMNHNLVKNGYRFCQSSFDDDATGSWLSVNHDPWGIYTTFVGYLFFIISSITTLLWPNGRFRNLLSQLHIQKNSLFLMLVLVGMPSISIKAEQDKTPVISLSEAIALQRKQVVYQNRIVPFNTVARDFVTKLYGKSNYNNLLPEQVIGGWSIAPEKWKDEKMIKIKNSQLREKLGIDDKFCCLADLFDSQGNYKIEALLDEEMRKPGIGKMQKAIMELDEKVGIILMLNNNTLMQPVQPGTKELTNMEIDAELTYNRIPFSKILFMTNITLGLLAFGLFIYNGTKRESDRITNLIINSLPWIMLASLAFHAFGYGLRWYISGRIPLNNGFETMQFLALCIMSIAFAFCFRYRFVLVFGFLMSGFTLLVAYLGQMNPQITPLMPVLNSPWLSTHVSFIMISYALFAFIMLNSIYALILIRQKHDGQVIQLTLLNQILTYPAIILLGIGIMLGAVWANESWGTYWSWDPKEVWALVTFMAYGASIAFHDNRLFCTPKSYHIYMSLAFLTVLMTYFGVNYLLGGMHSYAQ